MSGGQPTHVCPKCSSDVVSRVPRRALWDHLSRLLGWRVYLCSECGTRFYDRPSSGERRIA
jgi:hypothetical protein